jgi:hypothetical protein
VEYRHDHHLRDDHGELLSCDRARCHVRNYRVAFLSDATATYDYPDRGFGPMPNAEVHHATLVILAASTAHVMSVADLTARVASGGGSKDRPSRAA